VNRVSRKPPIYQPFVPDHSGDLLQISVTDPLLLKPGEFILAWYAGGAEFSLQTQLARFFRDLAEAASGKRIIFMGSSGGGFATLFYSWHVPESVALAISPQTNILRYYSGHVQRYVNDCWPNLNDPPELSDHICTNVCNLYQRKCPNTVVYVLSAGDTHHFERHMLPFAEAITSRSDSRFVMHCDYWGVEKHSGSVTRETYLSWLRAIAASPSTEVQDILNTRHALSLEIAPVAKIHGPGAAQFPNPADVRMATLLRTLELGAST